MSIIKSALLRVVAETLFSSARVESVVVVSEQFRIIELQADAFKKVKHEPGTKLALFINGHKRVYTPLSIDVNRGLVRLLIYLQAAGPGSSWAASAKVSEECRYMGPSSSLALSVLAVPCVLFGDKTSFAVASNLRLHLGEAVASRLIFEVNSLAEARLALEAIGLQDSLLFERAKDDSHLVRAAEALSSCLRELGAKDLIVTGRGSSIQTLRRILNQNEWTLSKRKVKAYWAPGKEDLD